MFCLDFLDAFLIASFIFLDFAEGLIFGFFFDFFTAFFTDFLTYFLNNGLGWKDIHCSIKEKKHFSKIKYNPEIHQQGFRYHLKKLLPSFIKAMRQKIYNFYNR